MIQPDLEHRDVAGRRIAYRLRPGTTPTLLFLPGYASDMAGAKAVALDAFAAERGIGLLRFDYSGTGASSGRFDEGTLERWIGEALELLDSLTHGPVILVGSSMGAWIALHVAQHRKKRIAAVVGLAPAPDFTDWGFGAEVRAMLAEHGHVGEPDPDGRATPHLMTRIFWESGQEQLLLGREIAIDCPVRLVHGDADREVPLDISLRTLRALRSADVQLTAIKGAGHRLSQPHEIAAILRVVAQTLEFAA
ncbi:MAG: alpha/beta hydrolase [Sphingomicrobium sp.]